ncbi:MAG: leucyl aminopeptidase family protein [Thalassovita sp.]
MTPRFAQTSDAPLPLYLVDKLGLQDWIDAQPARVQAWVRGSGFKPSIGKSLLIPGANGTPESVIVGYGTVKQRKHGRFHLAAAVPGLPEGAYQIESGLPEEKAEEEALGWLLTSYAFDRYAPAKGAAARLVVPEGVDGAKLEIIAAGEFLTRDLINTPTSDMGPEDLEKACADLAKQHDASISVITGDDLLEHNFPMIHAVGRASAQAPRLVDIRHGSKGPKLTLVGKGVCFDTGGLNLKPGASMGLMKKDMGGAATVLGLAHMIMALGLPVRLRVLIPAVENSVSGNSFRPQDILNSRKGLTVEINNTDAEGRLVLADALAYGAEDKPDLMLSMATLTGAARVAVGADIAPFFTDDDEIANTLSRFSQKVADPVWRLPFWEPYEPQIEPGIADLDNAPKGGFGGAITAALFLRRFAGSGVRYTHFDVYGWRPSPEPARTKGGVGMGARALLASLPKILGL